MQEHDALRERWVVWLLVQVYTAHQYTEDNVAAVACVRVIAVVDDEDKEDRGYSIVAVRLSDASMGACSTWTLPRWTHSPH